MYKCCNGRKNEKHSSKRDLIDSVYDFAKQKFGRGGYVKYWLNIAQTRVEQERVWNLIDAVEKCKTYIEGILDEVTKGKFKVK